MRDQSGFTLIEMLLSIAAIVLLVGLSLPVYQSFQTRNDVVLGAQTLAQTLRRAQTYASAVEGNSSWGVEIQNGALILFKGTSFSGRDTSFDETLTLSGSITPSGLSEVQFAQFTGIPNVTGTITLTASGNNTRTVSINAKGMVQ